MFEENEANKWSSRCYLYYPHYYCSFYPSSSHVLTFIKARASSHCKIYEWVVHWLFIFVPCGSEWIKLRRVSYILVFLLIKCEINNSILSIAYQRKLDFIWNILLLFYMIYYRNTNIYQQIYFSTITSFRKLTRLLLVIINTYRY